MYDVSQETLAAINKEVRRLCDEAYARAKHLAESHRPQLGKMITEGLLRYETLSGDEIGAVLRGDDLDSYRAARQRSELPPPRPVERPEPDVGLSGAEGLAHP